MAQERCTSQSSLFELEDRPSNRTPALHKSSRPNGSMAGKLLRRSSTRKYPALVVKDVAGTLYKRDRGLCHTSTIPTALRVQSILGALEVDFFVLAVVPHIIYLDTSHLYQKSHVGLKPDHTATTIGSCPHRNRPLKAWPCINSRQNCVTTNQARPMHVINPHYYT